jgi:CBS domain-containing membrane protein
VIHKKIKRGYRIYKTIVYKETIVDAKEHFWSFVSAFIGIGIIAYLQSKILTNSENVLLIGSFGASSVLIFGAIQSPLSQARNLIGGHVISAIVGVTVYKMLPDILWLTAPLAVAFSIVFMQITKTLHPPGGATALIAIIGSAKIKALGYTYVLTPVFTGCVILFAVAVFFNSITWHRSYPENSKIKKITRIITINRYKKGLHNDESLK